MLHFYIDMIFKIIYMVLSLHKFLYKSYLHGVNQIKDHYFCGVLAGGVCIKQCVKYTRQCQNKLGVSLSALSSLKRFQTIQCKTHMKLESILWEKIMNKTI